MSNNRYTTAQIEFLTKWYGRVPCRDLARELYGVVDASGVRRVHNLASRLGLTKHYPRIPPERIEQVRMGHADGLTDADIADRLGLDRRHVSWIRSKHLHLPVNAEAVRQAGRRAIEKQRRTLGIRSGGELRQLSYRRFARASGWPEELPMRAVQILNVLAVSGPQTTRQLVDAIGLPEKTRRHRIPLRMAGPAHRGKGGTYTAYLQRLGMIASLRQQNRCSGKGKWTAVYFLTPLAIGMFNNREAIDE